MIDEGMFGRGAMTLAPYLVGKVLVRKLEDGSIVKMRVTETEAYLGETDSACHASRGRTKRTEPLYGAAGDIYVYLCYGMHWLINIVAAPEGVPECVLLRAGEGYAGPARLTKRLSIDARYKGENILRCDTLRLEDDGARFEIHTAPRVGIAYAKPEDVERPCRFILGERL